MILPIGTRVQSVFDPKIVGTVRGYGTLTVPRTEAIDYDAEPTFVYLVWPDGMLGSSSLGLFVRVLGADKVEVLA